MNNPAEKTGNEQEVNEVVAGQPENLDSQIAPSTMEQVPEDLFAKGRERMATIGGFFTKAKEKFSAVKDKVGASLSRFWSRTKTAAGTGAAAVLSADVLAKKADDWVGDKVEKFGAQIGESGARASSWVGDNLEAGYDWTQEKADQLETFVETNWEKAKDFTATKAEQVKNFAADKVELAKDVAFWAKEKTTEGLQNAKEGIKDRWGKMKAFGEGAIAAAKLEAARVKDAYNEKINEIREKRLVAKYEQDLAIAGQANEKAEKSKAALEAFRDKKSLRQGLSMAA
ncbi:hypothetical protein KAZ66_04425 [Candidatus Woesebacteria bacterium]|jgi:hypothetical protein|nr:hypothetical protein [Candidatus Paceibacterota bacterium]MBP7967491.1 hypothetical protein [Candidatus Woesebacteria bacterium]